MLFDQGKLEKMTVRAFLPAAGPEETPEVSDAKEDTYVLQVNPSTSSLSHLLNYVDRQGQGDSASDAVYNNSEPTALEFEFLFDGTGVVPPPSELGDVPLVGAIASALEGSDEFVVMDEIAKFKNVVYEFDGSEHRPRKLLLVWGTLSFSCVLVKLKIRFTLFQSDGTPLRAILECCFREWQSDTERELRENRSSPDLTHLREVKEGDTLPLLAHRVYGNAALYLEVARVNKLVSFRKLQAGARLRLPPVEKGPKA